ncbi:Cerato-platanin [Crepidotus variabilis]|uniref:Cerato-platanin n=1 Tax=Crepidotus variabilis TaxID=179855 RepID=A0A9P6E747_9AGAR|nr:Cerato-platanin [Crepidotus variabilis]
MKFAAILSAAILPLISAVSVSYDTNYDSDASLATVACSDGTNGLLTKGYTTFPTLPRFPYIGGVPAITGYNSPACGTCWQLTYQGASIYVLGIDASPSNFNIALGAMNALTNGQAVALGRIDVDYAKVANSDCGLP